MQNNIQLTYQEIFIQKVETIVNKPPYVLLIKVLKNIVENPTEKKFQTVKKSEKISKFLTEEVIFILEKSGFKNKIDTLVFDEEKYTLLHETLIDVSSIAQSHQQLNQQDVINEWNVISSKADELLSVKENERCLLFYKQAVELVVGEYKKGYEFYGIHCCTAYLSLGKYYEMTQSLIKSIESFENAVKYIPDDIVDYSSDRIDLLAALNAYVSLARALLSLPQPDKLFDKIEKYLKIALTIAEKIEDKKHINEITSIFKVISYQKKDFNAYAFWDKKSKEVEVSNPYANRLMVIEQNMRGNPKKFIKQLIEIAEETEFEFPEFSGCLFGQIIYHHCVQKELNPEDGIEYGMKGLEIRRNLFGEKDSIVHKIYISLFEIYTRLGNVEKSKEYQKKKYETEVLLGLREDEYDY